MKFSPILSILALVTLCSTVLALPNFNGIMDDVVTGAASIDDNMDVFETIVEEATSASVQVPTYKADDQYPPESGTSAGIPLETATVVYKNSYPIDGEATSAAVNIVTTVTGYGYQTTTTEEPIGVIVGTPIQYNYGDNSVEAASTTFVAVTTEILDSSSCVKTVYGTATTSVTTITPTLPPVITEIVTVTNEGGQAVSASVSTVRTTVFSTQILTDTLIICRPTQTTVTSVSTETEVVSVTSTDIQTSTSTLPIEVTATVVQEVTQTVVVQETFTNTVAITSTQLVQETTTTSVTEQVTITENSTTTSTSTVFNSTATTNTVTSTTTSTVTEIGTAQVAQTRFITITNTITVSPTETSIEPLSTPCTKSKVPEYTPPSSY